jgi:hypothetical protein
MKNNQLYNFTIVGTKASGKTELFKSLVIENSDETEKLLYSISEHKRVINTGNNKIEITFHDSISENSKNNNLKKSSGLIITHDITKINSLTKSEIERLISEFESAKPNKNSAIILVGTNLDKVDNKETDALTQFNNLEKELSQYNVKSIIVSFKTKENVKELHDLIFKNLEQINKLTNAGNLQYLEMDDQSKIII